MIYHNVVVCDLRHIITVEEARRIESISNVVMLILPGDAPHEVQEALAAVPKQNVVTTLYLKANDRTSILNGSALLGNGDFPPEGEAHFVVNGVAVIEDLAEARKGDFVINGIMILHSRLKNHTGLRFSSLNGPKGYVEFDDYKLFSDEVDVDAAFMEFLPERTLIVCGDTIRVAPDVSLDMLRAKKPYFAAGNEIHCSCTVSGYVKANSLSGNGVIVR